MTGDTAWLKLGILVEFMPTGRAHTPPPFSAAGVGQQMSSRKNKSCVNRRPRSHMPLEAENTESLSHTYF